jgi:hypothetical protein
MATYEINYARTPRMKLESATGPQTKVRDIDIENIDDPGLTLFWL